jgi:hypothetical protein
MVRPIMSYPEVHILSAILTEFTLAGAPRAIASRTSSRKTGVVAKKPPFTSSGFRRAIYSTLALWICPSVDLPKRAKPKRVGLQCLK